MNDLLEKTLSTPVFMRSPHWRWALALAARANPFQTPSRLRSDGSLYEAAQYYQNLCLNKHAHATRRQTYPEMSMAHMLYTDAGMADTKGGPGWRWLIDALLLAGLEFDNFASALAVDLPADAVKLYHDTFFDVQPYLNSEPAVYTNILSVSDQPLGPSSIASPPEPEKCCLLRLFGYVWGPHDLLEYFYSRSRGQNRMHSQWVRASAGEMLSQQALTVSMSRRDLFREECVDVFKMAQKNWAMPPQELGSVEAEIRKSFLHRTVNLLSDRLRAADKIRAERAITKERALAEVTL